MKTKVSLFTIVFLLFAHLFVYEVPQTDLAQQNTGIEYNDKESSENSLDETSLLNAQTKHFSPLVIMRALMLNKSIYSQHIISQVFRPPIFS